MADQIYSEIRTRTPLITGPGMEMLRHLREHAHAPIWNHEAGDRINARDLQWLVSFRESLRAGRSFYDPLQPPRWVLEWVQWMAPKVPAFRKEIRTRVEDLEGWRSLPTFSREDIAVRAHELVPDDADLESLIVYRTAGTTGHALLVPHAPVAAASYQPLIEEALARHQIRIEFGPSICGCFLVGAQARTVTFPTVLTAWNQTGFVKLNLGPKEWRNEDDPARFFEGLMPPLLTGDPISFAEMLRKGMPAKPKAIISTAVAMSDGLRARLRQAYGCPVIDWYSLTETGPIGYACPHGQGYHVLPHDLFVEVLRPDGSPAGFGETGEITVTGGRNPFLPLLRYRTGDWGRMDASACSCGDPAPRILDLEGRRPVIFRAGDGSLVNPVDVSRTLREFPLVQHELSQAKDGICRLVIRPVGSETGIVPKLEKALHALFGDVPLVVEVDPDLGNRRGGGKVLPYRSEWLLEE